jgi:hypothetical protein
MLTVLPDARLVAMDVGHRVHNNAPDAYADLVLTFLEPSMDSATETMQAGLEQST